MGRLGADPSAPMVMSRRSTLEKEPWKSLDGIEHQVEADFLRPVLLGESVLPYRLLQAFEGVIPIDGKLTVLDAKAAGHPDRGYDKLAGWMRAAENLWNEHSANPNMSLIGRWNYQKGLSSQFPVVPLRIIYAASGSQPAAMVLRDDRTVIEHKLYWAKADCEEEAHYLCAVLNSETARARAEGFQSRGQFGARDFDKVIFNLPIPRFDAKVAFHRDLAAWGQRAEEAAAAVPLVATEKFQRARKRIRDALIEGGIAPEIEARVAALLDEAGDKSDGSS
jgi:hypothetical protein